MGWFHAYRLGTYIGVMYLGSREMGEFSGGTGVSPVRPGERPALHG